MPHDLLPGIDFFARRDDSPEPKLLRRREPEPYASAASATSEPSGFDFDVCFPQRLGVSAVNILLPRRDDSPASKLRGRRELEPYPSAVSATSAPSGFDFDVCFPQRLRVPAVNILLLAPAVQNTEAPKRLTMVIHPSNTLTGTES